MTDVPSLAEAQEAARLAYISAQKATAEALLPVLSDARTTVAGIFTDQNKQDLNALVNSLPQDSGVRKALNNLLDAAENARRIIGFDIQTQTNYLND